MKTAEELQKHLLELGFTTIPVATAISEIQRDAREGMVEANDVILLINSVRGKIGDDGWKALEALRAKHPNLFTK